MGSVLTIHFQRILEWAVRLVNQSPIKWIKIVDPPEYNRFREGIKVIGRPYIHEGLEGELILLGSPGAERYAEIHSSTWASRSYIHCWEGPNEPDVGSPDAVKRWVEFTLRWIRIMHSRGYKVGAGSFSVGCPQGKPEEVRAKWKLIGPVMEIADYLALHEYSAPTMQDGAGSLCLRYRDVVAKMLLEMGFRVPPILVTECGIDGGVMRPPHLRSGWRTWAPDRKEYLNQLAWYSKEIEKDNAVPGPPQVLAATIFTCGYHPPWQNFDIDEELLRMIVEYVLSNPPEETGVDFEILLGDRMQKYILPQTPGHALFDYGAARGWHMVSEEKYNIIEGIASQVFYTPDDNTQHHVWAKIGHWAQKDIRHFDRPN